MLLDPEACYRAVRARDRRFDGRFFTAVASTGIYCRPICPVRPPKRENMRFYSSAAAAEGAGYRPCLRCRPERAPGLATVDATSRLLGAAIAGIEEHAVSNGKVGDLAASLGVTDRHLRRVTEAELGVSPVELAQTQKLLLAKRLLSETSLKLTDIAFASGFGSVRRFNALFKSRYGLNPRGLRRAAAATRGLTCQLDFRPPLAWDDLLAYLKLRAVPGVEWVDATHYRRTVAIGDARGWISVSLAKAGLALEVEVSPTLAPVIGAVIVRVKHLFDLGAAPDAVSALLVQDPLLAPAVKRLPGLRVPGAFDGFGEGGDHHGRSVGGRVRRAHYHVLARTLPARTDRRSHARGGRTRDRCARRRRQPCAMPHGARARGDGSPRGAQFYCERRRADSQLDRAARHRSVDGTVHRDAGAALARRVPRRGSHAAPGRRT
jgi:AraC family transcriptional regulator of adaptative response / DNA-3-methyladenine glycosylase II